MIFEYGYPSARAILRGNAQLQAPRFGFRAGSRTQWIEKRRRPR